MSMDEIGTRDLLWVQRCTGGWLLVVMLLLALRAL